MVDYSKWSNMKDDSEEEEEKPRPRITRLEAGSSITFGGGKTGAKGASPIEVATPAITKPPTVAKPKRAAAGPAPAAPATQKALKAAPPPLPKGSLDASYAKWDAILADESDDNEVRTPRCF